MSNHTDTLPTATTVERGTVTLGTTTYKVTEIQLSTYTDAITGDARPASSEWHLTGPRGAVYFLRGFLGTDTGVRQVISWKSGQPLRVRGNEVRVIQLGDVIEDA